MGDTEKQEEIELTLSTLTDPQCIYGLGLQVASALKALGTCTMIVHDDGSIVLMNPLRVFIDAEAARPPPGVQPVFVRPILTNRRPTYVAVKEDGSVWEVEFPEPDEVDSVIRPPNAAVPGR